MGIEQIDLLLIYLFANRRYQFIEEIHERAFPEAELDIIETLVLLDKLYKDGQITVEHQTITETHDLGLRNRNVDSYFISFEGILFVQDEGYGGALRRRNIELAATRQRTIDSDA